MKKLILIVLLFVISSSLFAQKPADNPNENFVKVQMLIKDDIYKNSKKIKELSKDLTFLEKSYIFSDKEKSSIGPFFLNLCLGYGIGSWVQGDNTGGFLGTFGNLGGIILMFSSRNSSPTVQVGAILFVTTYLIELVVPFTHASSYNSKLKSVLGISDISEIKVLPNINYTQNGTMIPGLQLQVGF